MWRNCKTLNAYEQCRTSRESVSTQDDVEVDSPFFHTKRTILQFLADRLKFVNLCASAYGKLCLTNLHCPTFERKLELGPNEWKSQLCSKVCLHNSGGLRNNLGHLGPFNWHGSHARTSLLVFRVHEKYSLLRREPSSPFLARQAAVVGLVLKEPWRKNKSSVHLKNCFEPIKRADILSRTSNI